MISFSWLMAPQDLHSSSTFLFSWTMFSLGNLTTQVHEDGGGVGGGVGGPGVRGVGHDGAHNILQPGSPALEVDNNDQSVV